jgi:sn-1 stearoyl-lipid 9-desaturase
MSSRARRWTNGLGISAVHLVALLVFIPGMTHWSSVAVAMALLWITGGLGVTLCYHRALTHRGLRLVKPIEYALAALGTLALQGDPIRWVAIHRKHHAHADRDGDPHGRDQGFLWAHVDWLYKRNDAIPDTEELMRLAPDLYASRFYRALPYGQWAFHAALAISLFALGGWSWVLWGIFVRLVVSYHVTWFVNSAAHSVGYRTFRTRDLSTNCWWVAMLAWGEGWHNNHHAYPYSARHGLRWFEFDPTWWSIKTLTFLRLADRIRIPSASAIRRAPRDGDPLPIPVTMPVTMSATRAGVGSTS